MTAAFARARSVLQADQVEFYDRQGYLIVRQLFGADEIAAVAQEAENLLVQRKDLIDSRNIRCRWQPHCQTSACLFETFDPVIDIAPRCAELARSPKLLSAVGDLYGEPACLFKDKLIFKPPGARGHDLHQDYIAWPNFPKSFVTAAVAIDPADPANGSTEIFPGQHLQGYLSPADGDYHQLSEDQFQPGSGVVLDLAAGDVALFGCFTPHRSAPNWSERWRRLLYLSYNAASDGGDQRASHYQEFHAWLQVKYAQYGKTDIYFR